MFPLLLLISSSKSLQKTFNIIFKDMVFDITRIAFNNIACLVDKKALGDADNAAKLPIYFVVSKDNRVIYAKFVHEF